MMSNKNKQILISDVIDYTGANSGVLGRKCTHVLDLHRDRAHTNLQCSSGWSQNVGGTAFM